MKQTFDPDGLSAREMRDVDRLQTTDGCLHPQGLLQGTNPLPRIMDEGGDFRLPVVLAILLAPPLPFIESLDRTDLVSQHGSPLESARRRRLLHLLFHLAKHGAPLRSEKSNEPIDVLAIPLGGYSIRAGCGALTDGMKEARTEGPVLGIVTSNLQLAGPVLEHPLEELHGLTKRRHGRERPEDPGALESSVAWIPSHEDAREFVPDGDRQVRKGLAVHESLVEPRPDVLDQPGFQQQRFPFAITLDHVEIVDQPQHRRLPWPEIRGGLKIGGHPIWKNGGLPDIQDDPRRVLHQIDTSHSREAPGLGRQPFEPLVVGGIKIGVRTRSGARFRLGFRIFGL